MEIRILTMKAAKWAGLHILTTNGAKRENVVKIHVELKANEI